MKPPATPYRISQIAVVVKDIDAAMKTYHELFGWGPWNVYDHVPPKLHDQHLHGKAANFSMIGAECEVQPGLIFELIQPLEGDSIYKEHLEAHGESVQHIALMSHTQEESDAFKERFTGAGFEMSMGGRIGDTIEFFYVDTTPAAHFVAESGSGHAIEMTPVRQYPPAPAEG
jgi:methylmalonyl-CoA/ethylmalonyl-CoA epimerase